MNYISNDADLQSAGTSIIDHINYYENKSVIDRLTAAIQATEKGGLIVVIVFAIASIIIAIATVRLAIYSSRDEIAVMRLVGASNAYVRGPFLVAGIIAGVLSALLALIIFAPVTLYLGANYTTWLGGFNVFTYYTSNFMQVFAVLVGSGILLGGFASYLAVRRYLRA